MPPLRDAEIEGVVVLVRSDLERETPCPCCGFNPHICGTHVDFDAEQAAAHGWRVRSATEWLARAIWYNRFELEGKRVRLKIEVVDEELDAPAAREDVPSVTVCGACGKQLVEGDGRFRIPYVGVICLACYHLAQDLD